MIRLKIGGGVIKLMGPAILGFLSAKFLLIINTIFAFILGVWLSLLTYYADRLMELPTGVLGWH